MKNAGVKTLEWLFSEQLKVDAEWSMRTTKGFQWWADKHVQSVEIVGQETGPDGELGSLISIRTELLRSLELGDRELAIINARLMRFASMAGPVYDPRTKTLVLASLVRVYDSISQWMNPIISVAVVLQIGEAKIVGCELAKALRAEEALSGPPSRGMRPQPDEMAEIIDTVIVPQGMKTPQWPAAEFHNVVNRYMKQPPALLATSGDTGFTVEFPYGNQSSLCQVMANQPHPRYGNGLLLIQSFPVADRSDSDGVRLALSMNMSELGERPFGYGFGSYVYRKDTLHFTSFFPNAVYRPGLLPNIYFSCAQRAQEMSLRLTGIGWTQESFSPRHSAFDQIMDLLKKR